MPAPTVYRSTDASAPSLTGQAGSLLAVLGACLVDGYGAKAGAGWARAYADSGNKGSFRAASGQRYYFALDDNATSTVALGREGHARGYEAMSAVATGTFPFPTVAQAAAPGVPIRKSSTPDSTARRWIVVADPLTFYLFTWSGEHPGWSGFAFGEVYSYLAADLGRTALIGRQTVGSTSALIDNLNDLHALQIATTTPPGHWLARGIEQAQGTPVIVGKHGNGAHSAVTLVGLAGFPSPNSGGILLNRVYLHEATTAGTTEAPPVRGHLRGFWHYLHPAGSQVSDGDTFNGAGDLTGRSFLVISPTANAAGIYILETTEWEAST